MSYVCAPSGSYSIIAWGQVPHESYDFAMTKGIVEFGRGHYAQAADRFEQARKAVPKDPEATEYLGQTLFIVRVLRGRRMVPFHLCAKSEKRVVKARHQGLVH